MKSPKEDVKDQRFGRLTAIAYRGLLRFPGHGHKRSSWLFRCDCGSEVVLDLSRVKSGVTQSCGCLHTESNRKKGKNALKPGDAARRSVYTHYRCMAAKRGINFALSFEQVSELTAERCYYCGCEPSQICKPKTVTTPYIYNGIDRINSRIGYVIGNVVACCKHCNYAKNTMTMLEFAAHIERVYCHLNGLDKPK